MMIRPWKMVYAIVDLRVWVTCAFCAELEYRPVGLVLVVEEFDQLI